MTQLGEPSLFSSSGMRLGMTVSMSWKQKSPQSRKKKRETSPIFV